MVQVWSYTLSKSQWKWAYGMARSGVQKQGVFSVGQLVSLKAEVSTHYLEERTIGSQGNGALS